MAEERRTVKAAETVCDIVDVLEDRGEVGVTELADEIGLHKSTIHTYLNTLRQRNYVVKEGTSYRLSLRYLSLSRHVSQDFGAYPVIKSELDVLANETEEVSQFATKEQGRLVYVYKAEGQGAVHTATDVGSVNFFHCTGLGKVILAHSSAAFLDEIVERDGLSRKTDNTITSREALEDELRAVREDGYAIDDEEAISGLRCVAAPVFECHDASILLGAVSVSGPAQRVDDERIESELLPRVLQTANVIELQYLAG